MERAAAQSTKIRTPAQGSAGSLAIYAVVKDICRLHQSSGIMPPTRGSLNPAGGAGHASNNDGTSSRQRSDIRSGRADRGRASSSHPPPLAQPSHAPSSPMQAAGSLLNPDRQAAGGASGGTGNPAQKPKKNWLSRLFVDKGKSKADKGKQSGSKPATQTNPAGHTSQASANRSQPAAARAQETTGGMPSSGIDSGDDMGMSVDGDNFDDIIDSMFGFLDGHRPPQDAKPRRIDPPTTIQPPPEKPKLPSKSPLAGGNSAAPTRPGTQRPVPAPRTQGGAQRPVPAPRTRIGAQQPIPAPRTRVGTRRPILQGHGSGHGHAAGVAASSGIASTPQTEEQMKDALYQERNLVFVSEVAGGEGQINFYFESPLGSGFMTAHRSGFVSTEPIIKQQTFIVFPGPGEMRQFLSAISSGAILNHRGGVLRAAERRGFQTSRHTPTPHTGAVVLRLTFEGLSGHAPIAAMHADYGRVCSTRTMQRLQTMIPQAYQDSKNISYV